MVFFFTMRFPMKKIQLRKSVSLRSDTDSIAENPISPRIPTTPQANHAIQIGTLSRATANRNSSIPTTSTIAAPIIDATIASNPYAQPGWPGGQSHQTASTTGNSWTASSNTMPAKLLQAPPIPDPDYSLSESDGETENSILLAHNTKMNEHIGMPPAENSGNSHIR